MKTREGKGRKNPEETRRRIVEATVALHQEVGPAATTISAIADRADVQRLTVYRHMPDEGALIQACSTHWQADHPLPDAGEWAGLRDPNVRLTTALLAVYQYYRGGEPMLERVLRDEEAVQPLKEVMVPYHAWFRELSGQLSAGWGVRAERQRFIRALVGHALEFTTWQSLSREGLSDRDIAQTLTLAVQCVANRSSTPSASASQLL